MFTPFTPSHRGGSGAPLVCLHGFADTWRTWELVLPALERHHDVLAPTLPGHAGGPALAPDAGEAGILDFLEGAMDDAGFSRAHLVGNSLGGYLALQLAVRGRAESVVAFAPAGGWAPADGSSRAMLARQASMCEQARGVAPRAPMLLSSREGRRAATRLITTNFEHIPRELLAHQMLGVASCSAEQLIAAALRAGFHVAAAGVRVPVRFVWGTEDALLPWPEAAWLFRGPSFARADWVELADVGHCPQLDVPVEAGQLILDWTLERHPHSTEETSV